MGETVDEKDFALLRALKDSGNITHAADRLYLTQSALSKRIKAMERELGSEIIIRTRKGVRFTPAGEIALTRIEAAQRELEQLRREINDVQGEICGTLRAGFSTNYAYVYLPDLLATYHERYPRVQLDIVTGQSRDLIRSLQAGSLDVAVLRGEFPWDGMQYLLAQERVYAVCTAELADTPLSELTYINHTTDSVQSTLMMRWLHENDLSPAANQINVTDLNTCQRLVRLGLGWALLPEIALDGFDGCKRPCSFANGEPFVRRMYIDCQKESEQLPQVQALIELVKELHGEQ